MKHTGCLHFITLMNLLHLPTSVNCPQDIISHIQVVHRLQVKSMHSLIRVWFLNPFRLPNSQCEAYSQHLYKCQCCFVVDCVGVWMFSVFHLNSLLKFRFAKPGAILIKQRSQPCPMPQNDNAVYPRFFCHTR